MLEKLYNSQKKIALILVILLITFLLLPNFLYTRYELFDYVHSNRRIAKAGETVEFEWTIEQIGGCERHYEIRDIETFGGDWSFSIDGTRFTVPPDSIVTIYISVKVPENAENEERCHIQFDFVDIDEERQGHHNLILKSFTVYVDNRDPTEIEVNPGYSYHNGSGTCFRISPFIIIPLIIIIFCLYLFIMALTYRRKRLPPAPSR